MKKLLILVFLFPIVSFSQTLQAKNNKIFADQTIEIPGKTKDEIYKLIKIWAFEQFKNPSKTEAFNDQDLGIYSIRYISVYPIQAANFNFYNSIKLQAQDGKLNIYFGDISNAEYNATLEKYCLKPDGSIRSMYLKTYQAADKEAENIIKSITSSMQ